MTSSGESWYYEDAGSRTGPVARAQVRDLIRTGAIHPSTLVWGGSGDWVQADSSALAEEFVALRDGAPPPLPANAVDNRLAWVIAFVPLIGAGIEAALQRSDLWWVYLALNVGLCLWDDQRLKAAGYRAPTSTLAFIVPAYLWQRAALLKQPKIHAAVWLACFIATLFLPAA
jgi:hypothetical protein